MRYHLPWQGGLFCLVFFHLHFLATCSPFLPPSNSSSSRHLCLQDQRNALLHFKKSFTIENVIYSDYHYDYATDSITKLDCHSKTESWKIGVDCCLWEGVTCDAVTGRVIGLNLACSMLHGNLLPTSSLFQLQHLQQVDLSNNNFNGSSVPSQLGQLSKLTHLNLNSSNFVGQVPSEIAFLSRLVSLDLSFNTDLKMEQTTFSRLVQNLTRLRELSLNLADMSLVVPSFLMNLTSLLSLKAWNCGLRGEFPAVFDRPNFQLLDVANNTGLTGSLSLSNVSRDLHYLSLSSTGISIYLEPSSASHLMSLETLSLENCNIVKPNLAVVGNFTTLIHLDLSFNNLVEQTIPSTFGNLKELTNLYLANDSFGGPIPDFLGNLTKLTSLDLSQNDFIGPILPSLLALPSLSTLFLQDNLLTGSISPFMYTSLTCLDLSGNRLQGPLPSALFNLVNLSVLMLQSNEKLTDVVPSSICNLKSLEILDLSHNSFRGSIPQCLGSFTNSLQVFHLGMNNFQGTIPDMFSRGNGLRYLNLNGNELEGQVPESIINCRQLEFLDLVNNKIEDKFPHFLGTLPTLELLSLQSNKIHGCLSSLTTNYSFPKLRILDLSNNIMGGPLPTEFFSNFKAMTSFDKKMSYMREENYPYDYSVELTYKGLTIELVKIQTILITINLSGNRFKGEIPGSIAELKGLQHLNLSHNVLTGHIPPSLASLVNLESLDLSSNVLVGRIPMQLVNLTFLHVFNLSYNKLEGPVPQGYQFDTFDGGSYEGNSGLCGIPLPKKCKSGKTPEPAAASSNSEEDVDDEFFSGFRWTAAWMGYGCGLVLGLSIGYIALTTTRLGWFVGRIEGRWHGKGRRYRKNRH